MPAQPEAAAQPGKYAPARVGEADHGGVGGQIVEPGHGVRPGLQPFGGVHEPGDGARRQQALVDQPVQRFEVEFVAGRERATAVDDGALLGRDVVEPPADDIGRGLTLDPGHRGDELLQAPAVIHQGAQDVEDDYPPAGPLPRFPHHHPR